jgi:hypothetical protein
MREASHDLIQKLPSTSSWLNTKIARLTSGVAKTGPSGFPESGKYFYGSKLVRQPIQVTAMTKFRSLESSSIGVSSGILLLDRATNAWAMGASTDDVPALSSLDRVVRAMDTTTDALSPRMVRTYSGFWPWRLLYRRWLLRTRWPPVGQKSLRAGESNSPDYQTGPSSFPGSSSSTWSPARAGDTQWVFC